MAAPEPQDWLSAYAKAQRLADRDLLRILAQATDDIQRQIQRILSYGKGKVGENVRIYQLQQIRIAMLTKQAEVFKQLGNLTEARRLSAAAAAVRLNTQTMEQLFTRAGRPDLARSLGEALNVGLSTSIDVAVTRMQQSRIDLAQRIYNTNAWMDGRVERDIASALARGLSAREFAAEAVNWFRPDTPGGVRYAAMRLARTEINNAFHAMSVNAADAPWVKGMQWHLSRSHPKPDECDELARKDPDNLGPGIYKVKNVPKKPHPHCFCFVTPVVEDEDEFLDSLVGGKYDKHIDGVLASGRSLPPVPKPAAPKKQTPAPKKNPLEPSDAQKRRIARENERLKRARDAEAAKRAKAEEAKKNAEAKAEAERKKRTAAQRSFTRPTGVQIDNAKRHARRLVEDRLPRASTATRRSITEALEDAAAVSPRSMQRLNSMTCDHTEEWRQHGGPNTGAFYTYGGDHYGDHNHIQFNPELVHGAHNLDNAFRMTQRQGWQVKSYEDDGLKSITGHEYGHHIDKMATGGTGNWPAAYAQRMSDALGELLGVEGPHVSGQNAQPEWRGKLTDFALRNWVKKNEERLKQKVSIYGTKSPQEMFAEIWLAFASGNPATSPGLKKIARIMQEAAEAASGGV